MAWDCSCFPLSADSRSCLLSGVLRPPPGAHPAAVAPGPCSRDEGECVTIAFPLLNASHHPVTTHPTSDWYEPTLNYNFHLASHVSQPQCLQIDPHVLCCCYC